MLTVESHQYVMSPRISCLYQGSWIVKQSVGKKACLVGQALEMHHIRGKNYLEVCDLFLTIAYMFRFLVHSCIEFPVHLLNSRQIPMFASAVKELANEPVGLD